MALRQIEIIAPQGKKEHLLEELNKNGGNHGGDAELAYWVSDLDNELVSIRTVIDVADSENLTDLIERRFFLEEDFRVVIEPVLALIPRPKPPEEDEDEEKKQQEGSGAEQEEEEENDSRPERISREELYQSTMDMARLTRNQIILIILSTIVAVIGLMRGSQIAIIAAMLIAPFLGPHVGLALAATLADRDMAREGLRAAGTGIVASFGFSLVLGLLLPITPDMPEIASRVTVSVEDVVLALASGVAGTLSLTMNFSGALVGVMVALSLLPPLAASGMLLGAGFYKPSLMAGLLFLMNVICLNLAGVLTFLFQGVRPFSWWEAQNARKSTFKAIGIWVGLLVVLTGAILAMRDAGGLWISLPFLDSK